MDSVTVHGMKECEKSITLMSVNLECLKNAYFIFWYNIQFKNSFNVWRKPILIIRFHPFILNTSFLFRIIIISIS